MNPRSPRRQRRRVIPDTHPCAPGDTCTAACRSRLRTLSLVALLVALPSVAHALDVCEFDEDVDGSAEADTVRKAEKCVAGDPACCRELSWLRGWGPADLAWIPEELSTQVAAKLAELCDRGHHDDCVQRAQMLRRLGRDDEALRVYARVCTAAGRHALGACEAAGDLYLATDREDDALSAFEAAGSGAALRKAGAIHEARSHRKLAHRLYQRGCEDGDDAACAAARRLSGRKLARSSWEALYVGRDDDTLWIEDLGDGRIRARFHTTWGNGHTCDYDGEGTVDGARAIMDSEPGDGDVPCRPVFTRTGNEIAVSDPGGACRTLHCGVPAFAASFERRP